MVREEALGLLRGGAGGVAEWNRQRRRGGAVPELSEADLSRAILGGVHLRRADLSGVDLGGAVLSRADFSRAMCFGIVFGRVDLSDVKGLLDIRYWGPSTVGIDTLFRSKGNIPEEFLRGCGVPEPVIVNRFALIGALQPIQFYSCFISYSTKDQDFAERLHSRLRDKGLRVWFAPVNIRGGERLYEQIDQAIRLYDKLLLVLSRASMESEWVRTEIRRARGAEVRDGRRKLFPIRLVDFDTVRDWQCFDADAGKDLGVEVREYFIPDFTRWKEHDPFDEAFARLLRDLEAKESAAGGGH